MNVNPKLRLHGLLIQVQLVEEQLNLVARAAEDDMESEEKGADKLHMSDKADAASIRDDETQMDCG